MSDTFDHAGDAGQISLGMHGTRHTPIMEDCDELKQRTATLLEKLDDIGNELTRLRAENTALRNYLERAGWGPCNAAACNCQGWHKVRVSRDEIVLMAERDCLAERLRQSPEIREVVSKLGDVVAILDRGFDREVSPRMELTQARTRLVDLLRRLEEPQTGEQT